MPPAVLLTAGQAGPPAWFGPAGVAFGVALTVTGILLLRRGDRPGSRGAARAPWWLVPTVLVVVGPLVVLFWVALTQAV